MSNVITPYVGKDRNLILGYSFQCPGCATSTEKYATSYHAYAVVNPSGHVGPVWTFNGDLVKPTFSPSLLVNKDDPKTRCHLFMTDGRIRFLGDCWHALKAKTVAMRVEGK